MKKDSHLESKKRLEHILLSINEIETFTTNQSEQSFCENTILNNAVLFQFLIIGEAIVHVEKEKLDKYIYPWHKVRSFRNLISHEYFNIKLNAVWNVIDSDLPKLKSVIEDILQKEF